MDNAGKFSAQAVTTYNEFIPSQEDMSAAFDRADAGKTGATLRTKRAAARVLLTLVGSVGGGGVALTPGAVTVIDSATRPIVRLASA